MTHSIFYIEFLTTWK